MENVQYAEHQTNVEYKAISIYNILVGFVSNRTIDNSIWLGAYNSWIWKWAGSGKGVAYSNWDEGEPNRSGQCMHIYGMNKWDDTPCSRELSYACETTYYSWLSLL